MIRLYMLFKKAYLTIDLSGLKLFKMTHIYFSHVRENVTATRNKVRRKMHFLTPRMLGKWMIQTDGSYRYRNSRVQPENASTCSE